MREKLMDVPPTAPTSPTALLRWFFGVPVRLQTYANLLYLGLIFPLGTLYFTVLVTGFVTGGVLTIILVGVALLVGMLYLIRELSAFERWLATTLLGADIETRSEPAPTDPVENFRHVVTDLRTYTGLVYLFIKFAFGIGVLVSLSVLSAFTLAFILVPLNYQNVRVGLFPPGGEVSLTPTIIFELQTWQVGLTVPFRLTTWYVDSLPEALAVSAFGVLLAFASLHVCNGTARLFGWYTGLLLGGSDRSELRRQLDV